MNWCVLECLYAVCIIYLDYLNSEKKSLNCMELLDLIILATRMPGKSLF